MAADIAFGFLTMAFMTLPAPRPPEMVSRALSILGEASYSIYLIHPFTLGPTAKAIALATPAAWHATSMVAVAPFVALAASLVAWRFVETPLLAWCGRVAGLKTRAGG